MTYYGDEPMYFWIDGIVVELTEEQAEHYQNERNNKWYANEDDVDDIETATQADYDRQCREVVDAGTDPWVRKWVVLWKDGEPVLLEDLEVNEFMIEYADFDVSREYVMERTDNDDTIDCKCKDDYVCKDCYDFFQSLLDD